MNRKLAKLSFVLLEYPSVEDDVQYLLQWNHHLDGYSFFGGHIEEGETPRGAAFRELKEEVGAEELKSRRNVDLPDDLPTDEWQKVEEALQPADGSSGSAYCLPFESLRARRQDLPAEKNSEAWIF